MTERKFIPASPARTDITVSHSRFIAAAGPAFSVDLARSFIAAVRAEFPDATHHVPAYLIGHGQSTIAHCHDDGEPSGTAGRPVLAVIQGSGLGDIVVVVVRYFGGTKLGTGGLVRAYSGAAKAVLTILPRAEKVATATLMLAIHYSMLERVRQLVDTCRGVLLEEVFSDDVTMMVRFAETDVSEFQAALAELTHGQTEAFFVERNEATIMPL
jgi:uncharacterized YigZ family protein